LVVGDVLRDQGYQVLVAATTSKAVALTEAHVGRIDLLVSDLRLPEIGGVRLAELLRQMHPGLPVIFISGGVDMPSGVPNLLKPFEVSALLDLVRETLRAARDVANESVARH
jgi:DNA-binding NtrC family response regulator